MTGFELAVAYLIGWGWRRAQQTAGQVTEAVDAISETAVDRLRAIAVSKIGGDSALAALDAECSKVVDAPLVSDRTKLRVQLALEEAADSDPDFKAQLLEQVERIRQADGQSATVVGAHGVAIGGGLFLQGNTGAVVAVNIHGAVSTGGASNPPMPGAGQA